MSSESLFPAAPALDNPAPVTTADVRAIRTELLRLADDPSRDEPQLPGEVAAAWLFEFRSKNTREAYAGDLARFFAWCAAWPIDVYEIRRRHLSWYLAEKKPDGQPYAPKTLERRLAAIGGFYDYAVDLELMQRSPRGGRSPLVARAHRAQPAASLSRAEFTRLLQVAREHSVNALAATLLLGLYGLRVTEVCEMEISQIAHDKGQPVLRVAGKGRAANETTSVPLPPDVHAALMAAAGSREDGRLLVKASGRGYVRQEIAALLRTLSKRAAIDTALSPHGLRATFVTLALNEGVALRDVQDAARHADPRTTRLYDRDAGALKRHPVHRMLGILPDETASPAGDLADAR